VSGEEFPDERRWLLRFAGMPPNLLNVHLTPYVRARVERHWRLRAALLARALGVPSLARVRVHVTVYRRALGVADADGDMARIKPLLDGLVDAHVIPKDTRTLVTYDWPIEERRQDRDHPTGVELEIREVP